MNRIVFIFLLLLKKSLERMSKVFKEVEKYPFKNSFNEDKVLIGESGNFQDVLLFDKNDELKDIKKETRVDYNIKKDDKTQTIH